MQFIPRPRRSVLFMPASNGRALEKARELDADGLIFDLEDAVAPDQKPAARSVEEVDRLIAAAARATHPVAEQPPICTWSQ